MARTTITTTAMTTGAEDRGLVSSMSSDFTPDPVVGLLITAAIAVMGWQAAREVGRRLMDSVDLR